MTDAPPGRPTPATDLDHAVTLMLERIEGPLRIGAPLGLGKPHRLLNALYERLADSPDRGLHLYTALSLDPPGPAKGLEGRFLGPFVRRHFGDDFPRLAYVHALRRNALPAHMEVEEFYMQSGAMLGSRQAQRRYASLNYTHVARALADRRINVIVQKVAREPGGEHLSLSCNTDLTFDALAAVASRGLARPLMVAEVDPELPWLGGGAAVDADFFDIVVDPPGPHPRLFGLPRQPVTDVDYAIGFHASTLVKDGGTLQIGIGALADALCHALALRHADNAAYRRVLAALGSDAAEDPALGAFDVGLYGCSEMLNEGFRRLVDAGVIRRKVVDDLALMERDASGNLSPADRERLAREGQFLHGAFYLGSADFYQWLRDLPEATRAAIGMCPVSAVNELYGGNETLERLQRRNARFFNSCMMATALGAAVSDALEDGRVVSGVGGQYNFVAMAHALPDARSVLMCRAARDSHGRRSSNVVWNYGHATIPRHLRDVYITEYGIADLRGANDEDCIAAMVAITDADFQPALLAQAKAAGKIAGDFAPSPAAMRNTPEALRARLAPLRGDGTLPDYPLGSDFTPVEQRLVAALGWLKAATGSPMGKLGTVLLAVFAGASRDREALQRMDLQAPGGIGAWLESRLLSLALAKAPGTGTGP
ncbi:acetyl-CoA hydrolase/transferase C-terminal domain-containing protein [Marilutibacter aestuarii]|uniref:Acetyl-CoA hydrolase n=1 Tax=Marilutibacter aestuarii TaxID=1706195 RepID=A0A508ALM4_9GAMM|nr:acetyl-CoA hydrolase/transferase C-terminal domain-containing protein [Lysobacter aestuarii]TQD50709.1 acetyl-CoA hydrolase [Lysobacter aestuarii]